MAHNALIQRKLDKATKELVKVEEWLYNRIDELENVMIEMHAVVSVKKSEVEILQDEVLYYKYEKGLIEGELENKKDKIQELMERYKVL